MNKDIELFCDRLDEKHGHEFSMRLIDKIYDCYDNQRNRYKSSKDVSEDFKILSLDQVDAHGLCVYFSGFVKFQNIMFWFHVEDGNRVGSEVHDLMYAYDFFKKFL